MFWLAQSKLDWSNKTSLTCGVAEDGRAKKRARQSDSGLSQRAASPAWSSNPAQAVASTPANSPYATFLFIRVVVRYSDLVAAKNRCWRELVDATVEVTPIFFS